MKKNIIVAALFLLINNQAFADYKWGFKDESTTNNDNAVVVITLENNKGYEGMVFNISSGHAVVWQEGKVQHSPWNNGQEFYLHDVVTGIKAVKKIGFPWTPQLHNGRPVESHLSGPFPAANTIFVFKGPDAAGNFTLEQQPG